MIKFWIVMADKPSTTVSHRHDTLESAKDEAFRLSQKESGKFFYVLEAIGSVGVQMPPVRWHDADEDDTHPVDPSAIRSGSRMRTSGMQGDVVDDGCGSSVSAWCPMCHKKSMQVVRPGKFQCRYCG